MKFIKSVAEEASSNLALKFGNLVFDDTSTARANSTLLTPGTSDRKLQLLLDRAVRADVVFTAPRNPRPADGGNGEHSRGTFEFGVPSRVAPSPIFMTAGRGRNADFYGRGDVLARIDDVFLTKPEPNNASPRRELRSFVICGMGGLGKTEVASEYVYSRRRKFDAVFWLNADTVQKLNYGFMNIAKLLGLEVDSDAHDDVATREAVKGWLSKPLAANQGDQKPDREVSWLLVLDNVNDPDIMREFWPGTGTGCVIVTSRNPLASDSVYSPTVAFDLPPFGPDEAGPLLQSLSQREFEDRSLENCTTIAKLLGGLPLAVTQMGGIIRRRHLSLDDFLAYYAENAKKLHGMQVVDTDYKHTVASVWMLDALSGPATALLQVLSFLDPDRISEMILLLNGRDVPLPDFPRSRASYCDARLELIESSLISRNIKSNELRIHRLVQDVVRNRMGKDVTDLTFESVITLLSFAWPFAKFDDRNLTSRMARCETLFPHVEKLRSLFEDRIRSADFSASPAAASFFNEVSW